MITGITCGLNGAKAENTFWNNLGKDFSSPVTTPAKWYLLGGSALTLAAIMLKDSVDYPFQNYMSSNKPLGKWSHIGDLGGQGYANLAYALGMLASSQIDKENSDLYKLRAEHMFKSSLYTAAVTIALKSTVRAPRPNNPNEHTSWPSGHTSTAFSFASVVGSQHEWYWGAAAYSLATLTALSRLNDDRHYLRDVFAGATIAISYGLGIYYRQNPASAQGDTSKLDKSPKWNAVASLLPNDNLDGATFHYSARF